MKYLAVALLAAVLVFGARCLTIRHNLVSERQTIEANWAQVSATLERRAAIIPDLTQTVQSQLPGSAGDASAIAAVNDARQVLETARSRQEQIQANAQLDEALARLMLAVEAYPKLDGSKKYGDLLEALKSAEYQIALARRKYNEAVEHYNARIEVFPNNIVSSVSGLGKIDAYFRTPAP